MTITREDLTIERSTADWGGPIAVVTVSFPDPWTAELKPRVFELKSTEGMEGIPLGGHGIHVGEVHGGHRDDWRGAFDTTDMDKAVGHLVEYLNELVERQLAEQATESPLSRLSEALSDFGESLNDGSRRDFREEWARVRAVFVAVDMAMAGFARREDR